MYSDKKTWRLQWKIALENSGNAISNSLKFQKLMYLDASIGAQELVPLVQVPKPPTIHYQPAT